MMLPTIGNHDFDNGIDGLFAQWPHAKFLNFLSRNYDFKYSYENGYTKPLWNLYCWWHKIGRLDLEFALEGLVTKKLI